MARPAADHTTSRVSGERGRKAAVFAHRASEALPSTLFRRTFGRWRTAPTGSSVTSASPVTVTWSASTIVGWSAPATATAGSAGTLWRSSNGWTSAPGTPAPPRPRPLTPDVSSPWNGSFTPCETWADQSAWSSKPSTRTGTGRRWSSVSSRCSRRTAWPHRCPTPRSRSPSCRSHRWPSGASAGWLRTCRRCNCWRPYPRYRAAVCRSVRGSRVRACGWCGYGPGWCRRYATPATRCTSGPNRPTDLDLVLRLGVDGIITDRPAESLALVGRCLPPETPSSP